MSNLYGKEPRTYEGEVWKLYGELTLGASGAISSQSCKGFTVAKTVGEVGRYTVTLSQPWVKLMYADAKVVGAADAAYPVANGINTLLRNDAVGVNMGKTFDIQFVRTDTGADAEVLNSASVLIEITLKNTSSF